MVSKQITEKERAIELAISAGVKPEDLAKAIDDLTPRCNFDVCWVGECGKTDRSKKAVVQLSIAGGKKTYHLCEEHAKLRCHCGIQATTQCAHAGQFVCGAPLCPNCRCRSHG